MSVLKILTIPDKRLKYKSLKVEEFNSKLKNQIKNMYETLYATGNGIGLAAPQVNIHKRIVVIDLKEEGISKPLTLINPKILKSSIEEHSNQEGCLSIPGYYSEVKRPKNIFFEWYNEDGVKHESETNGLLSICIQHEIDHLNGVLFIDYLSVLKRKLALEKVSKNLKKKK